ncbi:ATP-dependent DNA helicase [Candidatus Enterococcus willemsii]|uniref:DNA 5'-3' helicase n=1 Tax=Candidatus Enterococcus willemsii TaxID=1857215 RepID=A0ABQ6Z230_9ENTE|nr:ATP-dependent DNA helicase [Enterococcus sp. CU12B]KAF1305612.1 ATP-dependent helicase [Enterococcus sp. CU12B]
MQRGKISVRKLVEFILRKGSIDTRKVSNHTAQEGARIHRKLQKAAGENYQKEVFLKTEVDIEADQLIVEGRADGIFKADHWTIDEIKTSEIHYEDLEAGQIELFFYQGMVYAYIYSLQNELQQIDVQLTYYQTTEEKITRTIRTYDFEFLKSFFEELTQEYHKWLLFQEEWRRVRTTTLQTLAFPYEEYRKGQRELAVAAYKTLRNQQRLFVEAPTGTGKTISTLFPALKALGEERADRIFYLTAKTITRQVAEDALKALADVGAETKSVTLTAKDKICFLDERKCNPDDCIYANGYYDRINEGLWDLLHHENQFTREIIEKYAKKHQLCPFELSLDVSLFCDIVVGDYNYLFDPTVYLRRFFEEPAEKYYFLVDEAHNLVNRSREMYSATLTRSAFTGLIDSLSKEHRKIHRSLKKVDKEFLAIKQIAKEDNWTYHHQAPAAEELLNQLFKFSELAKEWLAAHPEDTAQEKMLAVYFDCLHFLKISEYYDDHYETTVEITPYDMSVRQFCIEPAPFLEKMLDKGASSLLFSASFSPLPYYQEVLGGGEEALRYRLASPFPIENQKILVTSYIQTTYKKRMESLPAIVEAIAAMVTSKTGNYLVFFPSYKYLDDVYDLFKELFPNIQTVIQDTKMNEEEREQFLAKFQANPTKSLVGFCVLGGIFSEGIDLKGTRLIGSAIVGVGLPQINNEQELIREYFDEHNRNGFEYAYQLPGMNKVLQAAGRVIRDLNDCGVVLLLDQRFTTGRYRQLFPPHWQAAQICRRPQELVHELTKFWQLKQDQM